MQIRTYIQKLKEIWISDALVLSVVMVNTGALLVHSMCLPGGFAARVSTHVDIACVLYFILESAIKIKTWGMRAYWSSWWNKFDFLIVIASLPVLVEPLIGFEGFAVVLLLRLGRLLRLFRLMVFIPNLNHIALGISRALKASIGVFVALFILNVIFSIGATILFGQYDPEHFGNPFLSMYSTFRLFTIEGWYDIPDLIASRTENVAWAIFVRSYFVVVVIVGGVLGLSLANAVFIDQMTVDNTAELETRVGKLTDEVKELKKMITALADMKSSKKK